MKSLLGKQEATGTVRTRQARAARGSAASERRRSEAAAPSEGAREARVWKATNDSPRVSDAILDAAGGDELDDDDVSAELELASGGAKSVQVRSAVEGLKRHREAFNASIFPEGGFGSEEAAYDALGPAVEKERRVTGALRLYAKGELDADRVLEEIARCRHCYAAQLAKR